MKDIPEAVRFESMERIDKGWSSDEKYRIGTSSGEQWLLRICDGAHYEAKKREYEDLCALAPLKLPVPQTIGFGRCGGGRRVYQLLTYAPGQDALDVIPMLPEAQQRTLGEDAGRILRKIHTIQPSGPQPKWEERFNRKIDRVIGLYKDCPEKVPGMELAVAFVNQNRGLLAGRPTIYQHGDYHIGNMVMDSGGQLHIIDFNRSDYGDPWEEFNRILWCAEASGPFAAGRIDGYFDGNVPEAFFPLLKLYLAANVIGGVAWARSIGEEEVRTQMHMGAQVLGWYDDMKAPVPSWYVSG